MKLARILVSSVQVMLFADRLEVWNPGQLPPPLTIDQLSLPHASIPRNPLIAEPLFLAHYAEKAGSGILDMIALCRQAGLPQPEFRQEGGQFIQTIRRPEGADEPRIETNRKAASPLGDSQEATQSPTQSVDGQHEAHDWAHEAHDEAHDPISWSEHRIMAAYIEAPRSAPELLAILGYSLRTGNFKRSLNSLIRTRVHTSKLCFALSCERNCRVWTRIQSHSLQTNEPRSLVQIPRSLLRGSFIARNLLEMSMPDSPRSKKQQYRLTDKGRSRLAANSAKGGQP